MQIKRNGSRPSSQGSAGYFTGDVRVDMPFHFKRALENGVTHNERVEVITHLTFYAGWPAASTALPIARRAFEEFESNQRG